MKQVIKKAMCPVTLPVLRPLWRYRGFILSNVKREFQAKYRNSMLGAAWTILNPLAMIVVYTVIFSQLMGAKLPGIDSTFAFSIFLCSGLLTWGLFSEIVGRSLNVFLENANLLKKLSFPRLCLPVVVVINAGVNFAIIFSLFALFLLLTGNFPGIAFLAILPLLLIMTLFAIGLGITLGVLNVFFRDVGQFFGIFLQFWFWFTPIIYPVSILPEALRPLITFNPMTSIVGGFQTVFVNSRWPEWLSLLPTTILALFLCALGLWLFRRHAGDVVDEL